MGKVKITQEQARAIEERKRTNLLDLSIIHHVNGKWKGATNYVLNDLTLDELIRALYIGYEVEETFEVGDWIVNIYNEDVGIVTELGSSYLKYDDGLSDGFHNFRHATPEEIAEEKQRRLWYENGREVGEFKLNDVIFNKNLCVLDEIMTGFTKVNYTDEYEIICFAHNREDLKND